MECDLVPRDFIFAEQGGFERFLADAVVADQLAGVKDVNLSSVDHIDHGEQMPEFDRGERFLERLSCGARRNRFTEFHKAGWHGPVPVPRFDSALAEQYPAVALSNAADNDQRISVMNLSTSVADRPLAIVVSWDAVAHCATAAGTVFHCFLKIWCREGESNPHS